MEELKNLVTDKKSKGQWIWVLVVRLLGMAFFIAPLYLPFMAYFDEEKINIIVTGHEALFSAFGFFVSAGGKPIGMMLNSIGLGINNIIEKITK